MNAALRKKLSDFSKAEFIEFLRDIYVVHGKTESEHDKLVDHFDELIAPHPQRNGLLFWPEDGADDSPGGIATAVERFCRENGLPGFRQN